MRQGGVPLQGVLAVTAIGWDCGWWFVRFVVCCCDVCLAFVLKLHVLVYVENKYV